MWVYTLLPKILNMSLTAGIVIVFVLFARILLKKVPKIFSYVLWAVVLFRLVCPVSFSSEFSLIGLLNAPAATNGSVSFIPADIVHTEHPRVDLPVPGLNEVINENLPQGEEQLAADPLEWQVAAATVLWLCGVAAMLIYSAVSLLLLRRKLTGAVRLQRTMQSSPAFNREMSSSSHGNIYLADHIPSPFVLGIIHPKIYLPSTLTEQEQSYVILHEQIHIRRFDYIFKMIAFLALAMHWFNPLVWVAFLLCSRDMEMSCDERVLKEMGNGIKADYSASLLSLAAGRRLINGSPLAFGEGNIKGRIKNVLNFRKPAAWVIAASVVIVIALSVGSAANKADSRTRGDVPEGAGFEKAAMGMPAGAPTEASVGTPVDESVEGARDAIENRSPAAADVNGIIPSAPKLSPEQVIGADMAELDYASDDIVIFHGYFGLFVYDLNSRKIVRSLDLNPIGCTATQGDDYCDVNVSADGKTVQLHPMSSKKMYVYSVLENTLEEAAYERMENRFAGFVDIVDIMGLEKAGSYSYNAVKFASGGYGYLHTSDWSLSTLSYVRDDMAYRLFDFNISSSAEESLLLTTDLEQSISNAILSYYTVDKSNFGYWYETAAEGHITLESEKKDGLTYAYIREKYVLLGFENGILTDISGHANPAVIVFDKDSQGNYVFKELIRPKDGSGYRPSIEKIFSASALRKLDSADNKENSAVIDAQIEAYGRAYLEKIGRKADVQISGADRIIADMNAEVSNYLIDAYGEYPYWIGSREVVENDTRYIYAKEWQDRGNQNGIVTFTKSVYGGKVIEKTVIEVKGSKMNCLEGTLRSTGH